MVNGTLLKFGKRYEDNLQVIFGQWPKLYLALDALSDQKSWEVSSKESRLYALWYLVSI